MLHSDGESLYTKTKESSLKRADLNERVCVLVQISRKEAPAASSPRSASHRAEDRDFEQKASGRAGQGTRPPTPLIQFLASRGQHNESQGIRFVFGSRGCGARGHSVSTR